MQVKIIREAGYDEALKGMSFSFKDGSLDTESWWEGQREKAKKRAGLLAGKGAGHDKFLRQIQLWIEVQAPRCLWPELSAYKVGVVENSESTVHRLSKREPIISDFEIDTPFSTISTFVEEWHKWQEEGSNDLAKLKCALPEGYLQRRMITPNYANLRNIIEQRKNHRLKYWNMFTDEIMKQVEHKELLIFKGKHDDTN